MKILKLILGVVIGLIIITVVAEVIEFLLVKLNTDMPMSKLQEDREIYFKVRNKHVILVAKIFYSIAAGLAGGYLGSWISSDKAKIAIQIIIVIQVFSLAWAGFISDMSSTGPVWMWIYLIIVIPTGIWAGYKIYKRAHQLN